MSPRLTVSGEQLRAWRLARPRVCSTPLERVEPGLREAGFSGLPPPLAVAGPDALRARLAGRLQPVPELSWSPRPGCRTPGCR